MIAIAELEKQINAVEVAPELHDSDQIGTSVGEAIRAAGAMEAIFA
jgi:hypothetical protein